MKRPAVRGVLAVLAGLTLLAGGCSRGKHPPNLLLITVDTLRPDHLGYAGYDRRTSPAIDRLASEGVIFTDATSVAGWTLPSMATILTGQDPKDHGATDFFWSIDPALPTLASILRKQGYDTYGFVSHVMLTPTYGMGEGFEHFDFSVLNVGHPHEVATSRELTDIALKGTRALKEPWFVWVHYFDPHFQYLEHPEYPFGKTDLDRYDAEIAYTDYYIDNLLKVLDRKNTVVVFTSDHGEEFGEHGGQYHYTLHGEVMRVPLIIKAPWLEHREEPDPVQQIDLLPTMLALLGAQVPTGLPGRNVLTPENAHRPLFLERDRPPQWRQRGIVRGTDKLIVIEDADTSLVPPKDRAEEVPVTWVKPGIYRYDLAHDPGEMTNLFTKNDSTSLSLLGLLTEHFAHAAARKESVELNKDLLDKLRSLGYIN